MVGPLVFATGWGGPSGTPYGHRNLRRALKQLYEDAGLLCPN